MRKYSLLLPIHAWRQGEHKCYAFIFILMKDVAHQIHRVMDYFRGPSGRLNYDRLVLFAERQVLRNKFSGAFASIQHPAHYVNEAITRCLPGPDGKVARDLSHKFPLEVSFKGIIRSVASHELNPSEARKKQSDFDLVKDGDGMRQLSVDDFDQSMLSDASDDGGSRRHAIQSVDQDPVIETFINFVRKDKVVHRMLLLLLEEDIGDPAELVANRVGITVAEVYVARKRFKRLCDQFKSERRN